jgi:hypothetical protein
MNTKKPSAPEDSSSEKTQDIPVKRNKASQKKPTTPRQRFIEQKKEGEKRGWENLPIIDLKTGEARPITKEEQNALLEAAKDLPLMQLRKYDLYDDHLVSPERIREKSRLDDDLFDFLRDPSEEKLALYKENIRRFNDSRSIQEGIFPYPDEEDKLLLAKEAFARWNIGKKKGRGLTPEDEKLKEYVKDFAKGNLNKGLSLKQTVSQTLEALQEIDNNPEHKSEIEEDWGTLPTPCKRDRKTIKSYIEELVSGEQKPPAESNGAG